jgi:hypothetical protein
MMRSTFSQSTLTGMDDFWKDNVERRKHKDEFELKVLVWCAISEVGVSSPFIGTIKGQTVVYITKYLLKMVKFIEKYHKNDETIFCQYTKITLKWLEQKTSK